MEECIKHNQMHYFIIYVLELHKCFNNIKTINKKNHKITKIIKEIIKNKDNKGDLEDNKGDSEDNKEDKDCKEETNRVIVEIIKEKEITYKEMIK